MIDQAWSEGGVFERQWVGKMMAIVLESEREIGRSLMDGWSQVLME